MNNANLEDAVVVGVARGDVVDVQMAFQSLETVQDFVLYCDSIRLHIHVIKFSIAYRALSNSWRKFPIWGRDPQSVMVSVGHYPYLIDPSYLTGGNDPK